MNHLIGIRPAYNRLKGLYCRANLVNAAHKSDFEKDYLLHTCCHLVVVKHCSKRLVLRFDPLGDDAIIPNVCSSLARKLQHCSEGAHDSTTRSVFC